jgi:signal transduction histidine kinase
MKKIKYLLFLILLFSITVIHSQSNGIYNNINSISNPNKKIKKILASCTQFKNISSNEFKYLIEEGKKTIHKNHLETYSNEILYYEIYYHILMLEIDNANNLYKQVDINQIQKENSQLFIQYKVLEVLILFYASENDSALKKAYSVLALSDQYNLHKEKLEIYGIIAKIYYRKGMNQKELELLDEAIAYGGHNNFQTEKNDAALYMSKAALYTLSTSNTPTFKDSVNYYTQKSKSILKTNPNLFLYENILFDELDALILNREFTKADPLKKEFDELIQKINYAIFDHDIFLINYDNLQARGDINSALEYAKKSIQEQKQKKYEQGLYQKYITIFYTYIEQCDVENAFIYLDTIFKINNESFSAKQAKEMSRLEAIYKTKEKENEIYRQKLKVEKQKTKVYIIIIIFILFSLLTLYLFSKYKKNQNRKLNEILIQEKILKEKAIADTKERERNRISKELHDNIGSQLSYIKNNINFIKEETNLDTEAKNNLLQNIETVCYTAITDLRETIWVLHKENVSLDELFEKMNTQFQNRISNENAVIEYTNHKYIITNWTISSIEAINIIRIFQEAFSNILNHAEASTIKFSFVSETENSFVIFLEDNGVGFDVQSKKYDRFGLINMKERAEEFNCHLHIESQINSGTKIQLIKQ